MNYPMELTSILVEAATAQLIEAPGLTTAHGAMIVLTIGEDLFERSVGIISPRTGIPLERLEEFVLEARQASDLSSPVMPNQHVISKILLQEFCSKTTGTWRMQQYSFEFGLNRRLVSPSHVAAVRNFVKIDSEETEHLWNLTESHLPLALIKLNDGTLLKDPFSMQTVRDTMALHYARSFATLEMHRRVWGTGIEADPDTVVGQPLPYAQMFFDRYRIHAPSHSVAKRIIVDEMTSPTRRLYESGIMFRLRVVDLFLRAKEAFTGYGLEILRSSDKSEFLIGDVPSLTVGRDRAQLGVLGGVPLFDARTLIMPLGPRFMVSLSKKNEWIDVGSEMVATLNQMQVVAALQHVYFSPESDLGNFVSELRPPLNPRGRR